MRRKGTWIVVAALIVLGLQACANTTELTSAESAGSAPIKSSAVPNSPTPSESR